MYNFIVVFLPNSIVLLIYNPKKGLMLNQEVIAKAKKGDTKAFEQILFEYEKSVFGFIFQMTRNREDTEDLTQETFFKVYKKIRSYKKSKSFSTWIFAIAKNTTYDHFRKRKRARELYIVDDPLVHFENYYKPIYSKTLLEQANLSLDIDVALSKIQPVYHKVISMSYMEGRSYSEISKILQIPLNTVKTYIYRAKKVLAKELS